MEIRDILEGIRQGTLSVEEGEAWFLEKKEEKTYREMGYAKLDTGRKARSGFAEVVFCGGKPDAYLAAIYKKLYETDGEVFGTRATEHQYELVREVLPDVTYDPISRILKIEKKDKERIGRVAVCTAGTSDIPVAEEAAQTAEFFGTRVDRVYDVGVAGLHRGRHGRGAGQRHRRAGAESGHRRADVRGVRSEFPRPLGAAHYAEFLRQRHHDGQYRQRIRRGLCGDADQPARGKGTYLMGKKKVLYIEGTSGISGDMFVGAMIDLGADLEKLAAVFDFRGCGACEKERHRLRGFRCHPR